MNRWPRVSVVIPAYNCAPFLPEAIDSVLAQEYPDMEVIVVDDGSTDETAEILRRYGGRITSVSQPNRGVSAARNAGIGASTGEIVVFLDADDAWLLGKVATQVELFRREPDVGIVFTNYAEFGDDHGDGFQEGRGKLYRLPRRPAGPDAYVLTVARLFEEFLLNGANPCWTSTVAVRRSCLDRVGVFDEQWTRPSVEDMQLWLRLAKDSSFAYIDRILVRRRVRRARYYVVPEEHYRWIYRTTLQMLQELPQWVDLSPVEARALRRRIAHYWFSWGYFEFTRGEFATARTKWRASLGTRFSWRSFLYCVMSLLPRVRCPRSATAQAYVDIVTHGRNPRMIRHKSAYQGPPWELLFWSRFVAPDINPDRYLIDTSCVPAREGRCKIWPVAALGQGQVTHG